MGGEGDSRVTNSEVGSCLFGKKKAEEQTELTKDLVGSATFEMNRLPKLIRKAGAETKRYSDRGRKACCRLCLQKWKQRGGTKGPMRGSECWR